MKNNIRNIILLLVLLPATRFFAFSQNYGNFGDVKMDETELYTMTKQMSQFFSRFNYEEDQFGKKIFSGEPMYRDKEMRKKVLPLLFDLENPRTSGQLRDFFVEDLTQKNDQFFDFLGGLWYAEVSATFKWKGQSIDMSIILTIEKENLGSKWVMTNVYLSDFNKMFPTGEITEREKHFLHPMSHELDFMNIYKAFEDPQVIEYYGPTTFQPDYLTLFFYEVKKGNLKFEKVNNLKFHVFQIKNWYFEVSWFNREGYNSGWLISNLIYVKEEEKNELLKFYQPQRR